MFLHQAFDLKSLHFGLFADEHPRTPDGLHLAQANYTRTLAGLVPAEARTVLDVGSGLGDTSRLLAAKGYRVEGLSPDPYHREQYAGNCGPDAVFHLSRFEDFRPGRTYDCLVFGESPQYIDKDRFFPKCAELTAPGGNLVVAELFQVRPGGRYTSCFFEEDFVARAGREDFDVEHHRDITAEVLPTLEVGALFLKYGQRLFDHGVDAARRRRPVLSWLARLFFGRQLARVREMLHEKLPGWLDTEQFRSTTSYAMYRLRRRRPAGGG
jgi:MPBQ/MSBQ methyltransferase